MKINCIDCNIEYESTTIKVLDVERPLSTYCPACRTKRREAFELKEREAITAEIRNRKESWLRTCGIPQRYSRESFDTFKDRGENTFKLMGLCREYADEFPITIRENYKSLGLFSKNVWGNGKTHLVCSIAKRILERWTSLPQDSPVYYLTEQQMFRRIRATFNKSGETEEAVYGHLSRVPLLIIDDIGKEEVGDPKFVQRVWFDVVNERYNNLSPVVITANLDPDDIAVHLGSSRGNEAAFDRLYEMIGGEFWENTGKSYRRNQ